MKKNWKPIVWLLIMTLVLVAVTQGQVPGQDTVIRTRTGDPSNCTKGAEMYGNTNGSNAILRFCVASNTWTTLPYLIGYGTATVNPGTVNSGACTDTTTTVTGLATTDVILPGFSGDPTSTTGYSPSTSGMLGLVPWPSSNTLHVKVCNNTASNISAGSLTLNYMVLRAN